METEDKRLTIIEKINDLDFKIEDFNNKILIAQQENSEYASKLDGYYVLLNDYTSIRQALQAALEDML